jgi:hypothetical protein
MPPQPSCELMIDPTRTWKAWFDLSIHGMRLGWEAQTVIGLRLLRLGLGGPRSRSEAQRMVREKLATLVEAQGAAAAAAILGAYSHRVGKTALKVYRKQVRSNRRRLAR